MTSRQPVIFCDFDGTITNTDNIVAIMKHFSPAGYEEIMQEVVAQKRSIRDGVGAMFALMPSSSKNEIIEFVMTHAGIREGFPEFLNLVREHQIPYYVTSGGIDFFLKPLLEPFGIPENHIFCNSADFSGEHIEILWPHPCDEHCQNDCGMCKTTVMREFPPEQYERILIGDSLTDFEGARIADLVYSRSVLTDKCRELDVPHVAFQTFHDIINDFRQRIGAIHS
ncbi:2-hydroxy-3-keto-5-methylthiopentenyl-1-phosphate phosphatase [Paenibacillus bovis]|uniref:2-hydroxy-3-keto-5-methylthiopentenyl-1-phosphate phosphatase n=1 Tax=Paenibacillus bovis TaxID=1616788 RepID=A0A172ZID9_9BACL|nr:2-hydroxy-3-keto-5-methylthiopentenyl-1-phosphate phosphatase [Paenibacillus bovis]ANF97404.1 2-hydroxy-3-keto-5-methylthiopentenyl-1-phosphate phosphatase [Paenibacillus bovis]